MTRVVQSIFHQLRTNFVNTAFESLVKTASDLQALTKARPRLAIALGTGQSHALDSLVEHTHRVSYQELYAGAAPQALSHRGELTLGTINVCSVAVFSGRLHLYEGHSALAICQNVIFAKLLGCNEFLFTNAAGALNQAYTPGDVMILSDHLNLTGENPLIAGHPNVLPRGLVGAEELLHLLGLVVGAVLEPEGWRNLVDAAFFKRVGVVAQPQPQL